MKVQTSRRSFLTLESVAMTDIVMNLFIFFFISFSLLYTFSPQKESKIEVKLPQGAAKESSGSDTPLVVTITAANEIFIGKTRVYPNVLKQEIASRAASAKSAGLLVRSDKHASVDALMKVLDTGKQVGVQKLGVAIEQEK